MKKIIVVAGATGNLGGKIIRELVINDAEVHAIVRLETEPEKINQLVEIGAKVFPVDTSCASEIAKHCEGAHCMVSALAGLRDTVIDAQKVFFDAAVQANVPRFIPSDYSIDFTDLIDGQNRNLDLRRNFHAYIDKGPVMVTTIFNGAFMDLLTTDMPLILFKQKRILCWGNPKQRLEFTTTDNVAAFTALVALENAAPRYLRIAGDTLSCNDFVNLLSELTAKKFKLFRPGGIRLLNLMIRVTRFFSPSEKELYPAWQGMQYMRDMMEGRIVFPEYDNHRFTGIQWTSVSDFLLQEKVGID
jgi:nucleoside-diphosphate-sugar epimerase